MKQKNTQSKSTRGARGKSKHIKCNKTNYNKSYKNETNISELDKQISLMAKSDDVAQKLRDVDGRLTPLETDVKVIKQHLIFYLHKLKVKYLNKITL